MKSIKNSTVLNTWALLVDFQFLATATSTVGQLALLRRGQWKRRIQSELPYHKAESKVFQTETNLVSKRAKFNVDFEISGPFRKTSVRDNKLRLVSLIVQKSLEFSL